MSIEESQRSHYQYDYLVDKLLREQSLGARFNELYEVGVQHF